MKYPISLFILSLSLMVFGQADDPKRFQQEIKKYIEEDATPYLGRNLIVFTGSSSVRLWATINKDYPKHDIINRGFGGSMMRDLYYYREELILKYQPKQVFIYEGDNDIGKGKDTRQVMKETKMLVEALKKAIPDIQIVFISPKPSIARWNLKATYEDFNGKLEKYARRKKNVEYVDVWTKMLVPGGEVNKTLFIEDNLHMNAEGYAIWKEAIEPYLLK